MLEYLFELSYSQKNLDIIYNGDFKILSEIFWNVYFLSVILTSVKALLIGLSLATVIYFGGKVSGGNYNPAVSTTMFLKNNLNTTDYLSYVLAQLLGGICAYLFNEYFVTKPKS